MPNSEYGELVDLDSLNYALVMDSASAYSPGTVTYLAPAGDITHESTTNINKRYYDGKIKYVTVTEGDSSVKITVSGVPMRLAATLTGKPYKSAAGIMFDTGDASNAPWCALSGRMALGDGGYRYFQYLKGKFSIGAQSAASKKEDIDPKTVELTYTAVVTDFQFTMPDTTMKGIKGLFADTTDAAFNAAGWFSQVQTPATLGSPTAIALSSIVPAADATAVVKTADIVITFNNKIVDDNINLWNSPLGTKVTAITKTWDATGKICTLHPTSALAATTRHAVIIANVTDIYGQALDDTVKYFTTAS